jgi:type II secretory pathway pseudopilin PulG
MLMTLAVVALVLYFLMPEFRRVKQTAQLRSIQDNLRAIETAKDQWALDKNHTVGDAPSTADIQPYLLEGKLPQPVLGERYTLNPVGSLPTATLPVRLGTYGPQSVVTIP